MNNSNIDINNSMPEQNEGLKNATKMKEFEQMTYKEQLKFLLNFEKEKRESYGKGNEPTAYNETL